MEPRKFWLYIIRYVGNVVRGEFVNMAVCLAEDGDGHDRFVGFECLKNWDRLQGFFPSADSVFLRGWCLEVGKELRSLERRDSALRQLSSEDTNISVFAETKAVETNSDPLQELHAVAQMYLE